MNNVKLIIIIFLSLAFVFTIVGIICIAFLRKYNKKVSERSYDRRLQAQNRRSCDRRSAGRDTKDRRNYDRRVNERRMRQGSIFDRKNIFDNITPGFSGQNA